MKKFLISLTILCALCLSAQAAVVIDSVTLAPVGGANDPATGSPPTMQGGTENDAGSGTLYTWDTITVGTETYSGFLFPTATNVGSDPYYMKGTPVPGSGDAALSDDLASNAVANVGTPVMQFGTSLASLDRFFMFEVGGNDEPTLTLVDSNGDDVGTTAWTFSGSDYDYSNAALYQAATDEMWNGSNEVSWGFQGVSFTLDDFTGGDGDKSLATGFRFSGAKGTDLGGVMAYQIPEPTAASLLIAALAALTFVRRRTKAIA
jgi:hypothetical protein